MGEAAVIPATGNHSASFIFLHGLGDSGHGWCENFAPLKKPHIRYIFPHARDSPVTINGGVSMPSWFDLFSMRPGGPEDGKGIIKATKLVEKLINEEHRKGIPSHRIIIGGFSQGGALSLYTGLTHKERLGGLVLLSSWLPLHNTFPSALSNDNRTIPILQCHGTADPMVPIQIGQMTSSRLQQLMAGEIVMKEYDGLGHSSNPQEMVDVEQFIDSKLPLHPT